MIKSPYSQYHLGALAPALGTKSQFLPSLTCRILRLVSHLSKCFKNLKPSTTTHIPILISISNIKMGLMIKKPDDVVGSAAPAIIIGVFVAFGGILVG
jgi:hypothetical protein